MATPRSFPTAAELRGLNLRKTKLEEVIRPPRSRVRINLLQRSISEVSKSIVGQDTLLERTLTALLADGHLLVEGVPGLAKTRTVRAFAQVLGGEWHRVQFTPDLVPSDLVGTRVWLPGEERFATETGPVVKPVGAGRHTVTHREKLRNS
jgi:MoxR-like ATPase